MTRLKKSRYFLIVIAAVIASFSIFIKLFVATLGHNFDMESWWIVSRVMKNTGMVYTGPFRYTTAPTWSYLLWCLNFIAERFNLETLPSYHLLVTGFLAVIETGIAYIIYKLYGKIPAMLFLINPLAVLLTGYHPQIESVAILFGLISWYFYLSDREVTSKYKFVFSAIFMGLSLTAKHFFLFFPIVIFFLEFGNKKGFIKGIIFSIISYGMFFGSFLIEIARSGIHRDRVVLSIQDYVFAYKGSYGVSFLTDFSNLFFPGRYIDDLFGKIPLLGGYKFIYLILVLGLSYFFTKSKRYKLKNLFPLFLLLTFVFSPGMADQYIMLALPALSIFYTNVFSLIFTLIAVVYLATGVSANISNLQQFSMNLKIGEGLIPYWPFNTARKFKNVSVQAWGVVLAFIQIFGRFFAKDKIWIIYTILFLGVDLVLIEYSYHKLTGKIYDDIHIYEATYGENCGAERGNVTDTLRATCETKRTCDYTLAFPDPVPLCQKDFKVAWSCGPSKGIDHIYMASILKEAHGKELKIFCPAEKFGYMNFDRWIYTFEGIQALEYNKTSEK